MCSISLLNIVIQVSLVCDLYFLYVTMFYILYVTPSQQKPWIIQYVEFGFGGAKQKKDSGYVFAQTNQHTVLRQGQQESLTPNTAVFLSS